MSMDVEFRMMLRKVLPTGGGGREGEGGLGGGGGGEGGVVAIFISSPGALPQVSLCHGLLSVILRLSSVISFSHFRHLLQHHKLD